MSRKRYTPEQIIGKMREAEVVISASLRDLSKLQKLPISNPYLQFFASEPISPIFGK
jgi:hypothetical protein